MHMFTNPPQKAWVFNYLSFDFPADYHADKCLANINIEPPSMEEMYGKAGTPAKEQGHPCIREGKIEPGWDPIKFPPLTLQDMVLDINDDIVIDHTGRLSGTFVKFLASDQFSSVVRIFAHPETSNDSIIELPSLDVSLKPAAAKNPDVWFWDNPATKTVLIMSRHLVVKASEYFKPENVYKLICKWEFYENTCPKERLPISGFDEAVAFEVIKR